MINTKFSKSRRTLKESVHKNPWGPTLYVPPTRGATCRGLLSAEAGSYTPALYCCYVYELAKKLRLH